jgi:hypothetical protein
MKAPHRSQLAHGNKEPHKPSSSDDAGRALVAFEALIGAYLKSDSYGLAVELGRRILAQLGPELNSMPVDAESDQKVCQWRSLRRRVY